MSFQRRIAGLVLAVAGTALVASAALEVDGLRCEYLVNPQGIDEAAPRLSWLVHSDRRGDEQTAYQILVSCNVDVLAGDKGNEWDSGKVASSETAHIVYGGKRPLQSRAQYLWKVRAWDAKGKPSAWSKPAFWSMGLLETNAWTARWIEAEGVSRVTNGLPFVIRRAAYGAEGEGASVDVTARLTGLIAAGKTSVTVDNDTMGGDPAYKRIKRLHVECEYGGQPYVRDFVENTQLDVPGGFVAPPPPRSLLYMRKSFTVRKPARRAMIYATALGLYELTLNGKRVGDHVLAPEWTEYQKRVRYQAYDVTGLLREGENVLGAQIASGWYSGHIGNGGFQTWGRKPALLAQLEVAYKDNGGGERVVTDGSWKVHESPLLASDFMLGESHDARLQVAGWNQPGLDDSQWSPARVREEGPHRLESQVMEPSRALAELKPKSVSEPKPGQWTFDLGQNMVGVVRLKVSAPAGTKVTIRHAEMLNPDGTLYTRNLRGAPSVDTYICKGGGSETWQPQFTFHGFRYVELTGLAEKPAPDAITGVVIASDTPRAGEFSCSDPRVNQLQSNIQWGQRGNYLSVPTDCPQRDERLGWMGDAQVFVRTAAWNADVAAFFAKWMMDVDDSQSAEGAYSDFSPVGRSGSPGTPAWADAGVICPWTMYQVYGDKRILERHFPAMARWVEYCRVRSRGLIRDVNRGSDYGDWLSIGANTPKDVIGTAYFAYSTAIVAKSAKAIGRNEDAERYEQLFQEIKAAFIRRYVAADGRIQGNTQCVYAMALRFGLLPDELRDRAAQYLDEDISAKGNHLSTGFVGVSYLLPVLTQAGKVDTAYRLLLQDTFPSWLFSVKHGATTIWERWDGWTPDKGFQNPGMNSFNHYSLGSCGEWLFDTVGGIACDPETPGFKRIVIRPRPGNGLTWAKASYDSIRGRIASEWKLEKGQLAMDVVIPANTTATVYVPTAEPASVLEGGRPAAKAEGVRAVRAENGFAVYEVKSGRYRFAAKSE